jgi:ribosomal protein S18 acetylase RimI-like enzyme
MITTRRAKPDDLAAIWALNDLPNVGATADPSMPFDLPQPSGPPTAFPDLANVVETFVDCGGDFIVAEYEGHVVGMGGFRPSDAQRVEILRVRTHPALRRVGVGRKVMTELEQRAARVGFVLAHLDTATNQPEAIAFYRALGYHEDGTEARPEWSWTLVYFSKPLATETN